VEVGVFDRRSFSRCGDEESLVGREEGNRSQRPCLQAVVALKRGSKLHRVVRAERVALKQIASALQHRIVRLGNDATAYLALDKQAQVADSQRRDCLNAHDRGDEEFVPYGR